MGMPNAPSTRANALSVLYPQRRHCVNKADRTGQAVRRTWTAVLPDRVLARYLSRHARLSKRESPVLMQLRQSTRLDILPAKGGRSCVRDRA